MKMQFHKLCVLFPQMPDAGIDELAADIKTNGQRKKIVTFDGKILDGRNRFLACQKAKRKPQFEKFKGTLAEAIKFVISENVNRRHLTDSQRAMVAAEIATLQPGQDGEDGATTQHAADSLRVSARSVQTARAIKRTAAKPIQRLVRSGAVSLNAASKLSKLSKSRQRDIAKGGAKAAKKAAAKLKPRPGARDYSSAYTSAPKEAATNKNAAGNQKPEPVHTWADVTDGKSAAARVETIYDSEREWFNRVTPPRTPREIVDRIISGLLKQ